MAFRLVLTAAVVVGAQIETSLTPPKIQIDGPRNAFFIYDAGGNLIISMSPTAGTDSLGHAYPAGLNVSGGNLINVAAPVPGGIVFTTEVYGDANARFDVAVDGTMNWGNGTAPPDTNFYRPQTGQLQTDGKLGVTGVLKEGTYVVKETSGSDEIWQTVANGGIVLGAGWATDSTAGGQQPLQYRIDAEDNLVMTGMLHTTSAAPAGTLFTVPANWRPAKRQHALILTENTAGSVQATNRILVSTSGAVTMSPALAATGIDVYINISVPLGNMP